MKAPGLLPIKEGYDLLINSTTTSDTLLCESVTVPKNGELHCFTKQMDISGYLDIRKKQTTSPRFTCH